MGRFIMRSINSLSAISMILAISILPLQGETLSESRYPVFQKGICYASWTRDSYASKRSDESLETISDVGANAVQVVATWYQNDFNDHEIRRIKERSPSDKSIRHAIRKAHEYGMSVMLKPHIDLINQEDSFRADIGFGSEKDWHKWFSNYKKFIVHYARIAEREDVEFLCVGTELSYASTKVDYWREMIIPSVRKVYSGYITYAANWDNYQHVEFWDDVDFAGIDAYFPLSKKKDPTVDDLKEGWKTWVYEMEKWHERIGKPVVFTECGYCSADTAAKRPWEVAYSGRPNLRIQADCYRALFETFCGKSWFRGLYLWKWSTYAGSGGRHHKRFTPQNKPALVYVKIWYSRTGDAAGL